MKNFLKNYKQQLILLAAIIVGCIAGLIFKEKAAYVKPLGEIFLNLLLVIIVPLIFLTITTSIGNMNNPKRLGKVLITIVCVFVVTSLVSVVYGFLTTYWSNLVKVDDKEAIIKEFKIDDAETLAEAEAEEEEEEMTILQRTADLLTVNDFTKLISRSNIIALLVFSVLFGIAMNMSGKTAEPVLKLLNSFNEIVNKLITIVMYYAPIGLGCYFAALVGTLGADIAVGFAKTFIIYTVVAFVFYFGIYSLYAFIAGGKEGFIRYWSNIIPCTLTALGTCSSAACIPVNTEYTEKIGVPADIADTTIPLGTSFHKDGSIIGSMFKIMFLVCLFGMPEAGLVTLLGVALLANLLVTAVPIGGGTISEMLIITLLGFPVTALPVLTVIATIIDAPATMLNAVGDSASSMLVTRVVEGKDWINKDNKNSK